MVSRVLCVLRTEGGKTDEGGDVRMIEVNVKIKVDTTEIDRAIGKARELRNTLTGGDRFVFTASPESNSDRSTAKMQISAGNG